MSQDRLEQGLSNWPALAAAAGLPPEGWKAGILASRRDNAGDRVLIRLDRPGVAPVICKQALSGREMAALPAALAAQTRAAEALARHPAARAPRILAALPGQGVFVMEAAEGTTLAELVERGGDAAHDGLRRAGEWLDAFHRCGPVTPCAFRPQPAIAHLRRIARQIREGARPIPRPNRFLGLVADLVRRSTAVEQAGTLAAIRHGDLNARNILLGPNLVWGLDFSGDAAGPVAFDIARLVVHCAELTPVAKPTAAVPSAFLQGFFQGYRLTGADDPTLHFMILTRILTNWAGFQQAEGGLNLTRTLRFHRLAALAEAGFV